MKWITPLKKQCFVVFGVTLNMSSFGLVIGFTGPLLPQLRQPDSTIPIDISAGSWIAAIPLFTTALGNIINMPLMSYYGRRKTILVSIILMLIGWICIYYAKNVTTLIISRALHGFSLGINYCVCPVLIGEYTTPAYRGAFLTTLSLAVASGTSLVHILGSVYSWRSVALICVCIMIFNLFIVVLSPESPSWLVDQGRYEESKKIFRWLRGDLEEDELMKMIEVSMAKRSSEARHSNLKNWKNRLPSFYRTLKKKEFYIPLIIMIHVLNLAHWGGVYVIAVYPIDIIKTMTDNEAYVNVILISMSIQRIISNTCAVHCMKKFKRKTMLYVTIGINMFAYISTAVYSYVKSINVLPIDHPLICAILMHILTFSVATGSIPLPLVIAGEIFPLNYRSLGSGLTLLIVTPISFISIKTIPILISVIGLYGAFCVYTVIIFYSGLIVSLLLPETKDRTLQEIEEQFKCKSRRTTDLPSSTLLRPINK